jgi:hypothetical protein
MHAWIDDMITTISGGLSMMYYTLYTLSIKIYNDFTNDSAILDMSGGLA